MSMVWSGWLYSHRKERIRSLARGQLVVTLKNVSVMGRLAVGCILKRGIVHCSIELTELVILLYFNVIF